MTDPILNGNNDQLPPRFGLSARLLLLTVFFVLVAEFLIYAPSISRFRKVYLEERVADARLATLALEATPDPMVSRELKRSLLFHAGAHGIVLRYPERKMLILSGDMPPMANETYDLRRAKNFVTWIGEAFAALGRDKNRVIRVIGPAPRDPEIIVEVIIDEAPLHREMVDFSTRILQLSLVISFITAGLVYFSLQWLMVRPVRRIIRAMNEFRENPEDETRTIAPSGRSDEIGFAQRELAVMQDELRASLKQKSRLATLGAAVAKVNHDLRNSLATAVLASDRLATIDDPEVKKFAPRLLGAVNRAVALCSQTLNYAGEGLDRMRPSLFHLQELVAEVSASLRDPDDGITAGVGDMEIVNRVDFEVGVTADRVQLFRALSNLCRNAAEADAKTVTITAAANDGVLEIIVADDGLGFKERAKEKLFQPFAGSAREGGTGLGLVIVRDIFHAHGGDVELAETGPEGTRLRLTLPHAAKGRQATSREAIG